MAQLSFSFNKDSLSLPFLQLLVFVPRGVISLSCVRKGLELGRVCQLLPRGSIARLRKEIVPTVMLELVAASCDTQVVMVVAEQWHDVTRGWAW